VQNIIKEYHEEWHSILNLAFNTMDSKYLDSLKASNDWLPGMKLLLNAFSMPLSSVKYILIGESPYPRQESANGYAFFDAAVNSIWSEKGLSKEVNRATSLRNMLKMLLFARGDLNDDLSQEAIAAVNKSNYVQTCEQLFNSFMQHGILLLNASLVYSPGKVAYHANQWHKFIIKLFEQLSYYNKSIELILLGKIAEKLKSNLLKTGLLAEHPYNISFITNRSVVNFFKPLDLLLNEK